MHNGPHYKRAAALYVCEAARHNELKLEDHLSSFPTSPRIVKSIPYARRHRRAHDGVLTGLRDTSAHYGGNVKHNGGVMWNVGVFSLYMCVCVECVCVCLAVVLRRCDDVAV